MSQFEVGDVVCLKSGGPLMTVAENHLDFGHSKRFDIVVCKWFDGPTLKSERFETGVLEKS